MTKEPHPADGLENIEMLSQPLTTEEGYLNEACLRELEAAIKGIPESHTRLADNAEWATPWWVMDTEIVGQLAHWAIRQFRGVPPNLKEVLGYTLVCLRDGPFKDADDSDDVRCVSLSLCQINKFLWDVLDGLPQFVDWNSKDKYGDRFIDLSALLHNVCVGIRDERRHHLAFDQKFEEKYGSE